MELKERQKSILNAIIREYVRTARPIASKDLALRFHSRMSPATIRNEMLALDEYGFLEQPHTSAGRIPTDQGYRFFVDNLISRFFLDDEDEKMLKRTFAIHSADEFVREFSKLAAQISGTFAAAGLFEEDTFYDTGFSEILEEPEFQDIHQLRSFGKLVDALDEEIPSFLEDDDLTGEQIYIGEENPWEEARDYAFFIAPWEHPRGFRGFLTLIGPKRMNYTKNISLIRFIQDVDYD